jgi:two-component system sensor histidine kinase DegS
MVDKDPAKVKLELQSLINMNKEIINDMREIIFDLRPMSLSNIGFVSAVESYCQHLRRNDNLDVVLKISGQEQELSSITSVTLYRILQESPQSGL